MQITVGNLKGREKTESGLKQSLERHSLTFSCVMMTKISITFAGLENKVGDQAFSVAKCSQTGNPSATGF